MPRRTAPTRDALALQVIRLLRRRGQRDARYDPATVTVFRPNAAPIPLEPLYRETARLTPRERRARITTYVRSGPTPPPPDWSTARDALRPVLHSARNDDAVSRPVLAGLTEMIEVEGSTVVTPQDLRNWGKSRDEVFAAAHTNLGRLLGRAVTVQEYTDPETPYATSYPLINGWLKERNPTGAPVAFLPDRDTLVVLTDPDHATLLDAFALVEADFTAADRPLTPMAFTSDDLGRTVPYDAPPGHPLHHAVRRAERLQAVCRPQPGTLPLRLVEREDGSTFTYTVWSGQTPALLPRADLVALREEAGMFFVPWADLAHRGLIMPDGIDGTYLAVEWPDPQTRAGLQKVTP